MRKSGSDDAMRIAPKTEFSLEESMEYIKEDEYSFSKININKKILMNRIPLVYPIGIFVDEKKTNKFRILFCK